MSDTEQTRPLAGLLVVSLEQAVAAPMCSCRLADAGARVIKIERPEGDFARGYDDLVHGESAYFVWLNRGKESLVLDLTTPADKALLEAMLAKADVFIQNLKPGAVARLGFALDRLRRDHPRLITCSVSGYGETGPYAQRKAYDLLIQAEAGLASVTGGPEAPARVGVSVVDIAAGMNAYEAILEALIARGRTGQGTDISISMFDAMADWMTVPLLQHEGGQHAAARRARPSVDRALRRVQDPRRRRRPDLDPERPRMARAGDEVLGDASLADDPRFATNVERVKHRAATDARVAAVFGATDVAALTDKLAAADIAFARVSDTAILAVPSASPPDHGRHAVRPGLLSGAAAPPRDYGAVPALGEHTEKIREEFAPAKGAAKK